MSGEQGKKRQGDGKKGKKPGRRPPLCLNPKHAAENKRCYMNDCDITSPGEARRLLQEYKEKKFKEGGASKKLTSDNEPDKESSTLILATFSRLIQRILCTDIGSDINLMPPDLFEELRQRAATMVVKIFDEPRRYALAAKKNAEGVDLYVECDKQVTLNVELFIRHGLYLELRNLTWYVATSETAEPLLGRPTLEALGINTRNLLAAATDCMGNSINMEELMYTQEYPEGTVARMLHQGVYHSDNGIEQSENWEDKDWLDLGKDTEEEKREAIERLVKQASDNGISGHGRKRLSALPLKYYETLRIRLGNDPPAEVEPMKVELYKDARPFRAKPRRYSPEGRVFMERYVQRVIEYGFGKVNTNAKWVAAPVLVEKPGAAKFRLTFDYRPVNAATVPIAWPMPHIDSELIDLAESRCFASIDFVSGYWQLPLAQESQEPLSFMTPTTVVQPTRCTQGAKNAGPNFQSKVEPLFANIRGSLKAWLDDFLLHSPTEDGLLDKLGEFLDICTERRLKISALKSNMFQTEVKWCGRVIDKDGIRFDPRNLSGLQGIHEPYNGGELYFASRIAPFKQILEDAYARSGSRTKKSIKRIALKEPSWGEGHSELFHEFQETLKNMVRLAHRDIAKALCVYTDASDAFWSGVVTQCDQQDLDKGVQYQRHEPLAFLGSALKGSELWWSTFEKEAYAIVQVFKRMDYLFMAEKEVHVFTDHRNLLFVYNPLALDSSPGRHIVNKVQRWGLFLSRSSYVIEHIAGENNIMADIMTRWYKGYRGKRATIKRITHALQQRDIVESPLSEDFDWPTYATIDESQRKHYSTADGQVKRHEDGLWTKHGKVWIPEEDEGLQLKILVIAHCGAAGHRGKDTTSSIIKETYIWDHMMEDCAEFVQDCLHCLIGKSGHKVPRPISITLHGTRPNEVIHFDFLYLGPGVEDYKYALVIQDDLSSYKWLCPAKNANAETVAVELARWIRTFTVMEIWVSDQGSHFKNKVMKELADEHKVRHNFCVAYSPWVNGTVESCMRHIQAAYRCLQSELKLGPQDWPSVLGMIMTALNEAPLKRLGPRPDGTCRTPLEVMTGLRSARKTLQTSTISIETRKARTLEMARAMQLLEIEKLQDAFEDIHKTTRKAVTCNRQKHIRLHNKKTNLITPNFSVGDFVLVRRAQDKGHKMSFRWMGPRRVSGVLSELVYEVEHLITHQVEEVHAARLMMYRESMEGYKFSDELLKHAENSEAKYEMIEKLLDISKDGNRDIFVQVQWLGLPDRCDWTWQPLQELYEDIPERLTEFLTGYKPKKKVVKDAIKQLELRT